MKALFVLKLFRDKPIKSQFNRLRYFIDINLSQLRSMIWEREVVELCCKLVFLLTTTLKLLAVSLNQNQVSCSKISIEQVVQLLFSVCGWVYSQVVGLVSNSFRYDALRQPESLLSDSNLWWVYSNADIALPLALKHQTCELQEVFWDLNQHLKWRVCIRLYLLLPWIRVT